MWSDLIKSIISVTENAIKYFCLKLDTQVFEFMETEGTQETNSFEYSCKLIEFHIKLHYSDRLIVKENQLFDKKLKARHR